MPLLPAGAGREPDPKLKAGGLALPAGAGSDPDPKLKAGGLVLPAGAGSDPDPKLNVGAALAVDVAVGVAGWDGVGTASEVLLLLLLLEPKVNGAAGMEESGAPVAAPDPKPAPVETRPHGIALDHNETGISVLTCRPHNLQCCKPNPKSKPGMPPSQCINTTILRSTRKRSAHSIAKLRVYRFQGASAPCALFCICGFLYPPIALVRAAKGGGIRDNPIVF